MMLLKTVTKMTSWGSKCSVISLTTEGPIATPLRQIGVPVQALNLRKPPVNVLNLSRLSRELSGRDIVQSWMYHSDLLASAATRYGARPPVVWGIRQSYLDSATTRRSTLWVARICARLSEKLPSRIVCCSEEARRQHSDWGYSERKMEVIPNGFDLEEFKPDPAGRTVIRRELRIPDEAIVIGLVARFDRQKDHHNFFSAAARAAAERDDLTFVLCGDGIEWTNSELVRMIDRAGVRDRCHLLGPRSDMPRVTAGFDIATSASVGEGFPNSIGEAMACAVPCVVTDVGDSRFLVGDSGVIVPPRDPDALAGGWLSLAALDPAGRTARGVEARARVARHFDLNDVAARYLSLYEEVVRSCAA